MFFLLGTLLGTCIAHDPGLSSAEVIVSSDGATVHFSYAPADIEDLTDPASPLPANGTAALTVNGIEVPGTVAQGWVVSAENAELRLSFPRSGASKATFSSRLLEYLPLGHRQYLTIKDANGTLIESRLLSARENSSELVFPSGGTVAAAETPAQRTFPAFLLLGIEHILIGYDHLLFLLALLIVCESYRSAITLITCFTIAHSITLALATFDVIALPSQFVEIAIAASIIYVGVENLILRRAVRWRWVLTFSFGLLHGLGFAGVLRELGIGEGGGEVAVPLLAFNLGVELGQIAVAAIILPILFFVRRQPSFLRVGVPATSLVLIGFGAYWMFERVTG